MRVLSIALIFGVFVIVPFALWGEWFELVLDGNRAVEWLQGFGFWAALVGIALLAGDIFLPLPASGIMAALGVIFGPWFGGLVAAIGNFLAGAIAFGCCRAFGAPAVRRLVGEQAMARDREQFLRIGIWLVAGCRALPVLPEITSCLAGVYGMPWTRFAAALAIGAALTGFGFAILGYWGRSDPAMIVILATLLPPLLLFLAHRLRRYVPLMGR